MLVQALGLVEIEDVEADFVIGTRIFDLVKEPLRMSLSVDVI